MTHDKTDLGSDSQIKRYIQYKNYNVLLPSVSFSGRCAVGMFLCHKQFFYFPPNMPVQNLSLQKHNILSLSSDTFKAQSSLVMVNIQFLCWFFSTATPPKPLGLVGNGIEMMTRDIMSDHAIHFLMRLFLCFTSPSQSTNQKRREHAIQAIISVETNMQDKGGKMEGQPLNPIKIQRR